RVQVGDLTFDVIHLRGHPPGSIALALEGPATGGVTQLFTGDCLFPGGLGRTTKPAEFDLLYEDVKTRVFDRFGDETVVYPGHGEDTTRGAERPHLEEWRKRRWEGLYCVGCTISTSTLSRRETLAGTD